VLIAKSDIRCGSAESGFVNPHMEANLYHNPGNQFHYRSLGLLLKRSRERLGLYERVGFFYAHNEFFSTFKREAI
jgi:hypothetical protein